jgi:divalent metal cation (Fe/Co/Zn/Cd) transporter
MPPTVFGHGDPDCSLRPVYGMFTIAVQSLEQDFIISEALQWETTAGNRPAPLESFGQSERWLLGVPMTALTQSPTGKYWQYALWLALFTIVYNLAEGLVSVYFGAQGETLTLFGFGLDSFIEVMSGIGVLAMVVRIRQDAEAPRSRLERTALRVTGTAFYLLSAGLAATSAYNLFNAHRPETTLPGLIISLISLAAMWALVAGKRRVGRALNSSPILADANCTMVCIYMSLVLLASSLIYQVTGLGFVDSLGALGLIYFSTSEGKEAFQKAAAIGEDCGDE